MDFRQRASTIIRLLGSSGIFLLLLGGCGTSATVLLDYAPALKNAVTPGLEAQFFGVSTILVTDGEKSIMVDGYFSRPCMLKDLILLGTAPNKQRIKGALTHVKSVDAVLVAHSHFDHAMDAPTVASKMDAPLVGSKSTWAIALGQESFQEKCPAGEELPKKKCFRLVEDGPLKIGDFEVHFFKSRHAVPPWFIPELEGDITQPLKTPARAWDYKSDGNYTFLLRHPKGNVLIVPSTNWPLGLDREKDKADVVFLSVGYLSLRLDEAGFLQRYWQEAVIDTEARLVIPIHWDTLSGDLQSGIKVLTWPDNVERSMKELRKLADAPTHKVELATMQLFETMTLPRYSDQRASVQLEARKQLEDPSEGSCKP